MDYKTKAINCVKDTALPVQMKWFKDCDFNMDTYCQKYAETESMAFKSIALFHNESGKPLA